VHQRLALERIRDDGLGQQIGRGDTEALQAARRKEQADIGRGQRQHAADRVDHQAAREHALAPVGVGDRPEDQLAQRISRHVAGNARLDRLRRGGEVMRHRGQRRNIDVDRELTRR
jgi:hypothetical protein